MIHMRADFSANLRNSRASEMPDYDSLGRGERDIVATILG